MRTLLILAVIAAAPLATAAIANSSNPGREGLDIGRCIVKADRAAAIDMMKSLPLMGEAVDWSTVSLGRAASCHSAGAELVSVSALRGGIAQELFRRDFDEFGMQPHRAIPDLAKFSLPVEKDTMGVEDPEKTLFLTADCVARSNPMGTEKLIKAEPGSGQEMKIIESLGPWLSACQGKSQMAYGRTDLRSAIIQAAYHVSQRYWAGDMTYAGPAFRPGGVR